MASSLISSTLPAGFVDIATKDVLEDKIYGGETAITYFIREYKPCTWFTQVPTVLAKNGTFDFGQEPSANITRAGDYLLQVWLRTETPEIILKNSDPNLRIRWTRNFMHNLIKETCVTFNDMGAGRLDNYFLDFWTAFTVPANKYEGYQTMIGNVPSMIQPHDSNNPIRSHICIAPLPYFFTKDSGMGLATAALLYNEMKLQYIFREAYELLIVDDLSVPPGTNPSRPARPDDLVKVPHLSNTYVWANYAIVTNEERKRMGQVPRDFIIEQVQTNTPQDFMPDRAGSSKNYDLRFSHAVKALFFAVRNNTTASEWSNYTTTSPTPTENGIDFDPDFPAAVDPIKAITLLYESTVRLSMPADYFSLVQPYYQPNCCIPRTTGIHMYSYSLDVTSVEAKGSTNYGKISSITMSVEPSDQCVAAGKGLLAESGTTVPQSYRFIICALAHTVARIRAGAFGFPVM